VSLVLALYNTVVLFSSTVFGRLGDTLGRKKIVIMGFAVSGVVFLLHNYINDISSLYVIRGLAGLGAGMIPGPLAALVGSGSVGIFTAFGSFGFLIASLLAGVLQKNYLIFTTAALLSCVGVILSFFVKEKVKRISVPVFPLAVIKKNLDVYIPYLIRHSAATAVWAIFPVYIASLGADRFTIGILYAINPLMQGTFMIVLAQARSRRLITIGLVASAVTFLGYAAAPHWSWLIVLQALLGFSWANLYLGSMKHLLENNEEQATATGILNSIFGMSGIVGPLFGGFVAMYGMRVLLFFSAVLAFSSVIVSRSLRLRAAKRLNPQREHQSIRADTGT
jgi:MFS family permease